MRAPKSAPIGDLAEPPVGQPLRLLHRVLPRHGQLWGAGRPSFPDEPPSRDAVEAGAQAWRKAEVGLVVSLIEDWEVPRRAPGLFEALSREGLIVRRFPIRDFGVPSDVPAFARLLDEVVVLASLLKVHGLTDDPVAELRRIYRPTAMQEPTQEAFVRGFATP
jgi:hypothetical protein